MAIKMRNMQLGITGLALAHDFFKIKLTLFVARGHLTSHGLKQNEARVP